MALFVPVIIGVPIGYFTWATVFNSVDNCIHKITSNNTNENDQGKKLLFFQNFTEINKVTIVFVTNLDATLQLTKPPNSSLAAVGGTVVSVSLLGKLAFTPQTRHRLFFAKAPPNSNIRIETLKMGIELLVRSGVVFYGGATGGAIAGRLAATSRK
jgi:hypothetical protein